MRKKISGINMISIGEILIIPGLILSVIGFLGRGTLFLIGGFAIMGIGLVIVLIGRRKWEQQVKENSELFEKYLKIFNYHSSRPETCPICKEKDTFSIVDFSDHLKPTENSRNGELEEEYAICDICGYSAKWYRKITAKKSEPV
jgi:hypothetical protein